MYKWQMIRCWASFRNSYTVCCGQPVPQYFVWSTSPYGASQGVEFWAQLSMYIILLGSLCLPILFVDPA